MQVPPLDDLPLYTSKAEAGVTLESSAKEADKQPKTPPSQSIGGESTSVCTGHEAFETLPDPRV